MSKLTFAYKTIGDCEIHADVYGDPVGPPRPVIMWIHGGALIMGRRDNLTPEPRDLYLAAGYTVVSIDYRLAPETKLPAILEDVEDAFRWVRAAGPELFRADPERIALVGHSAGGYLALTAGLMASPRPRALVSFYGYGDIVGPWYSRPDPCYCRQPRVTAEEAWASVGTTALSGTHDDRRRERFYLYCRQQGRWPHEVVGHDPDAEPEAFTRFCPVWNVTVEYPPTMLLHGDQDTDVPHQQSVKMAQALAGAGVPHEFITIPGGEHGFDADGGPAVDRVFQRVLAFLGKHV
jgi:acetyl esterase/lipase